MSDYCDGSSFAQHPLFSVEPQLLQVLLYYDDVEIYNALGTKVKRHKFGMLTSD